MIGHVLGSNDPQFKPAGASAPTTTTALNSFTLRGGTGRTRLVSNSPLRLLSTENARAGVPGTPGPGGLGCGSPRGPRAWGLGTGPPGPGSSALDHRSTATGSLGWARAWSPGLGPGLHFKRLFFLLGRRRRGGGEEGWRHRRIRSTTWKRAVGSGRETQAGGRAAWDAG